MGFALPLNRKVIRVLILASFCGNGGSAQPPHVASSCRVARAAYTPRYNFFVRRPAALQRQFATPTLSRLKLLLLHVVQAAVPLTDIVYISVFGTELHCIPHHEGPTGAFIWPTAVAPALGSRDSC